jgi:hypothetical protein
MKIKVVLFSVSVFLVFMIATGALAKMKTFIRDYTYQASELDSKQSCRLIATEQVKRLLLEELGTYLESHTEVVNYELTKDQITTLTGGIVKTKILEEKWDGEKYWLKAKIDADPDEVAREIEKLRSDRKKVQELEESRRKTDVAMKDMDNMRKDMESSKDSKEKIDQYNEKVQSLKLIQAMAESFKALQTGKTDRAMGTLFDLMEVMIQKPSQSER